MNLSGKPWNWIAAERFFFRGQRLDGSPTSMAVLLQIFCVGLASLIPLGSGADRWRLKASCLSTALLAGFTYPLFAHWVWGGGWLAQLGANYGLGRGFIDAGGASSIHVTGGLSALAVTWILGPRRGKYSGSSIASAIPGHNGVYVLFGSMLALLGWLGLNCAGAILFAGSEPKLAVLISINTMLCAAAAALTAAILTGIRFGKPDASLTANGWIGGLVASSAACAFIVPAEAVIIGSIAGGLVIFSVEWLELRLKIDDPGGSISVHAIAGIWGLLALGVFGRFPVPVLNVTPGSLALAATGSSGQWLAQLAGVATLIGFVFPLVYAVNFALNRICPFHVAPEGERQGMDLYELGAGAYPEFVIHTEDFTAP